MVAVDSVSSGNYGPFSLEIADINTTPPVNQSCSAATPVTVSTTPVTVKGDTTFASNEFNGVTCGPGSTWLRGNEVYYSFKVTGGKSYFVSLNPTFAASMYAFDRSVGCSAAGIQSICKNTWGTSGYLFQGSSGYISPAVSGTFVVAVDSADAAQWGPFSLTLYEK